MKYSLPAAKIFTPVLLLSFFLPMAAQSCNVPVFRYALERWHADPYRILIYQNGPPEPEALKAYEKLMKASFGADSAANLIVRTIDASTEEGRRIAERSEVTVFPWMEVLYPGSGAAQAIWSGPLTMENAERVIHSPARTRLSSLLLEGTVAVWIFLESGDPDTDNRSAAFLESELKRLSEEMKIPETGMDTLGNLIRVEGFDDFRVTFSMIRVSKSDPEEQIFVRMLLGIEPDLAFYEDPMAFPVFGRGRALYGLIGRGIGRQQISDACYSLINWCSCEIKAENPGTDILVEADWSSPAGGKMVIDEPLPALTGLSHFLDEKETSPANRSIPAVSPGDTLSADGVPVSVAQDTVRPAGPGAADRVVNRAADMETESSNRIASRLLIAVLSGIAVVAGLTVFIRKRQSRL